MEAFYRVTVWAFRCLRCEHTWLPRALSTTPDPPSRAERPRVCPKCKSPYWDRPRRS